MASSPEIYPAPIEILGLSLRSLNSLKRARITTLGQLLEIPDEELLRIRNFSDKPLEELYQKLAERGIARHPGETPEPNEEGEEF